MSQIYSSGNYFFTFDSDGVNAHTLDGVLVSGITTGFTPWLVDNPGGYSNVSVVIEIINPGVPPMEPTNVIVPEPHFGMLILGILLIWAAIFLIGDKKDGN